VKKGISPGVTVIVIILVIIIAGLLWYVFSTPRAGKGPATMNLPITMPTTPERKAEVKAKAAEAQMKLRAEMGKRGTEGGEKAGAPAAPAPTPGR
jgi:peptidoglycan/LPS O-acetylase OafA/YrhL